MYAIIETGSKQYRVKKGDTLDVELLSESEGNIELNSVILLNDGKKTTVGAPHVNGAKVLAEVIKEVKGPKVISYKYKRRKNYRRKMGHRQKYARIKVIDIVKGEK